MRTLCLIWSMAAVMVISCCAPVRSTAQAPMATQFYYMHDHLAEESLLAHARQIALLSPVWLEVGQKGNLVSSVDEQTTRWATERGVRIVPVVVNQGFRPETAATATGPARERLIAELVETARRHQFGGLQLDFEGIRPTGRDSYSEFAERLAEALHRERIELSIAVPAPVAPAGLSPEGSAIWADSEQAAAFDYARLGRAADFLSLMAYDEFTSPEAPGPVAGMAWVEACIRKTVEWTPSSKVMLGVALYHRHWAGKKVTEGPFAAAVALAQSSQADMMLDATHEEATFRYSDAEGDHIVWLENADTLARKVALAGRFGLRGISAWRLGQEDPAIWDSVFLQRPEKKPI